MYLTLNIVLNHIVFTHQTLKVIFSCRVLNLKPPGLRHKWTHFPDAFYDFAWISLFSSAL